MDIKTAGRTLDVFEAFETLRKPMTLSELASRIGAPVSSCHGLVRTLRNRGYLYTVSGRSLLYPTKKLLKVATAIATNDPILAQLGPILADLRERTAETVILGKRLDTRVVYLEVLEGPQTIRYAAQPGRIIPLHSSAIGKAMLGIMPDEELSKVLRTYPFERVTEHTITQAESLLYEIRKSRARGYYVTRGENVRDVMAIARPLDTPSGSFGIAIAGPIHRMEAHLGELARTLEEAGTRIRFDETTG